jgi:hypothetical protein
MKIAYIYDGIYPYIKGGAEKRFWDLATRLARKGHEVHIFGRDPGIGQSNFVKEGVHIHAVSRHMAMYSPGGTRLIFGERNSILSILTLFLICIFSF